MNKLLIIGLFFISACTSKTSFGPCIGIGETENPNLAYKYSSRNIVIGIIFSELVFPPVLVAVNEIRCPVGEKK